VKGEDVEIAFRMAVQMLTEGGGIDVIKKAVNESQDPAMVIGQFLAQLMGQLAEKLQAEAGIDPKIFLAKDGWLDLMLNYIEKKLGYPPEFSDQVYTQVLDVIKAAAQSPEAPNNVMEPDAPQGPPPPQGQPAGGVPAEGQAPMGVMP
jgi:hypothetical protein